MKKLLSTKAIAADLGLLLLRLLPFAFLAFNHGIGKFNKLTAGGEIKFYDFDGAVPAGLALALAVVGELIAPLFIMLGLYTRFATIPVFITMVVAAFGAHADSPLKEGEHALLFGIFALILFFIGPGKYSLDKKIYK